MTTQTIAPRVYAVPAIIGFCLWAAATGLMVADAFATGHVSTTHLLAPILTASTVAAAVIAHHRLMSWRVIGAAMFGALALFGSVLTAYNTLGRVAGDKDAKLGDTMRDNRNLDNKLEDLKAAKAGAKVECVKIGPRCTLWQARVDTLTRETSSMSTKALNPQIDSVVKLATLLGFDGARVRQLIEALDAPSLPLYLEIGSIIFFGAAFPHRRASVVMPVTVAAVTPAIAVDCVQAFSKGEALRDFERLRESGSQKLLAQRWHVHPATVGRWLADWQADGAIVRGRDGKHVRALIAAPRD